MSEVASQPEVLEEKAKPAESKAMLVNEKNGQIIVRDQIELMRVITMLTKGAAIPKTLDTIEKVIAAWQMATALNVAPQVAIQNMAVIHGTVSIWGQLPKALAHNTREVSRFELLRINEKQEEIALKYKNLETDVWAALVRIQRGNGALNEYYFSMKDAEKAGLDKKSGPWQDYRAIMLCRRTVGQAIKFEFPDALMGLNVAEYDFSEAPDLKDVTPSKLDELNKAFSNPPPPPPEEPA